MAASALTEFAAAAEEAQLVPLPPSPPALPPALPPATPRPITILGLPRETQKDIVSHCSQSDLICLSLVCKHFRELAAEQLYRNFHIVFPDEDDPTYDSPIDGLAGGLDTFVTSDYDYAKHLKDISLDTLSSGPKAEAAYKSYLYNVSCGKFMNTLLLMTLRKAKSLETFRWNIRVELSRPVFKALHEIQTLKHLHMRLQAGPSLYEVPPPLPYVSPAIIPPTVMAASHMPDFIVPPPPPPAFAVPSQPSLFYVPPTAGAPPPPLPKPPVRIKLPKKTNLAKEPPTLSGFKNLKSLSVLDIDTLDVVTEIKSCVRNSSGTLTKLKLSFSEALALQARKPPPDLDPEESDPDDEFQVVPIPTNVTATYADDVSGPAKAFRAQEERKSQEAVLGRIFDVEPYLIKKPKKQATDVEKAPKEEPPAAADPGEDFLGTVKETLNKLMLCVSSGTASSTQQQEVLDAIEAAARKYAEEAKTKGDGTADKSGEAGPTASADASSGSGSGPGPSTEDKADDVAPQELDTSSALSGGLFDETGAAKAKDVEKDVSPEDIDIEEPEGQLVLDEGLGTKDAQPFEATTEIPSTSPLPAPATEMSSPKPEAKPEAKPEPAPAQLISAAFSPNVHKAVANLAAQKMNYQILAGKLESFEAQASVLNGEIEKLRGAIGALDIDRIVDAEQRMQTFSNNIQEIQREMHVVGAEIDDAQKQIPFPLPEGDAAAGDEDASRRRVSEYVRSTRGLALKSISIYLMPVKASVISKAIDLRVLERITLLNVGPQAPIWTLFAKENRIQPLPLRKIFTDNVTMPFLNFVSQLRELRELFMIERDSKYKPESFAPKTTTTIDHIRRLVFKRHAFTLRRLMIKNMAGQEWDLDDKTILLFARRGRNLEELAASMNIRTIHTFMQQLRGFARLRALHIIQLRNDDTCVWVMRETKRFLIDNLSHYPEMRLEWLSIDDDQCAERIIRPVDVVTKPKKKKKQKGKEKAAGELYPGSGSFDGWDPTADSDEEEEVIYSQRLDTVEGVHFSDVWGVRIFKKEMTSGRL